MLDVDWDGRRNKQIMREQLLGPGPKVVNVLTLPGNEMLCLRTGMSFNRFSERTHYWMYEYEPETAAYIKQTYKQHIPIGTGHVTVGNLFHSKLEMKRLDVAYIDLCGVISREELDWISNELRGKLRRGSVVGFTHTFSRDNTNFLYLQSRKYNKSQFRMTELLLTDVMGVEASWSVRYRDGKNGWPMYFHKYWIPNDRPDQCEAEMRTT